ncbi:MAG: hypothetical protein C5B53_04445 [Candidatus Melainabacteria bacterium]|nr:MAG: hypothetical protein C5B53_04445 [Candidatus Melainabacteria bacterium]
MRCLSILTSLSVIISMFVFPTELSQAKDEPAAKPPLSAADKSKLQQMLNADEPTKTPAKKGAVPTGTTKKSPVTTAASSSGKTGKK